MVIKFKKYLFFGFLLILSGQVFCAEWLKSWFGITNSSKIGGITFEGDVIFDGDIAGFTGEFSDGNPVFFNGFIFVPKSSENIKVLNGKLFIGGKEISTIQPSGEIASKKVDLDFDTVDVPRSLAEIELFTGMGESSIKCDKSFLDDINFEVTDGILKARLTRKGVAYNAGGLSMCLVRQRIDRRLRTVGSSKATITSTVKTENSHSDFSAGGQSSLSLMQGFQSDNGSVKISADGHSTVTINGPVAATEGKVVLIIEGQGRVTIGNSIVADEVELFKKDQGSVTVADIHTDKIVTELEGFGGEVEIRDLKTKEHTATISGSSKLSIVGGEVHKQDLTMTGGRYIARGLESKECKVAMSGNSTAKLNVSDKISGTVSGFGQVKYAGNPKNEVSVSGFGYCKPIGR